MKKKALFILNENSRDKIYGPEETARIRELVDVYAPMMTADEVNGNPDVLRDCNIVMSGWGGPCIDREFLMNAPGLEAVFYGAGSIRGIVTEEFWEKDIPITSSWTANAVPVAEFTFAQIILCLKNTYRLNKLYTLEYPRLAAEAKNKEQAYLDLHNNRKADGAYKTKVGIISMGMIGRMVCEYLKSLDVEVLAYDPFISEERASELGASLVSLERLFRECNIISLHSPWLPETEGMIKKEYFEMMRPGASFINTARGAIVHEEGMIEVLEKRSDITAVLDVTYPEPPEPTSPLFTLDNVFLTPHIAGSMNDECRRMGAYAADELERYIKGEKLLYRISRKQFSTMA